MTMALVDQPCAVGAFGERTRRELTRIFAEPHGAAQVVDAEQIA